MEQLWNFRRILLDQAKSYADVLTHTPRDAERLRSVPVQ